MKNPVAVSRRALLAAATLVLSTALPALAQVESRAVGSSLQRVSPALRSSSDLGRVSAVAPIHLTVHLAGDKAGLDKAVADIYNPLSPNFHKWLTTADLKRYAPTEAQVATVRQELEAQGLTVLSVAADNLSVRVSGTAGRVETAFNTELHQFSKGGATFRANTTPARLSGAAGQFVSSVAGLESHTVQPMFKRATNLRTGQPYPGIALSKLKADGGLSGIITDQALSNPTEFFFNTPGADLPLALYYGNQYAVDPTLTVAFTAPQLQAAYGLPEAYAQGLDGTGQTIVLLEAYGYPDIEADANAFSALNGLPPLTDATFSVVYPEGPPKSPLAGVLTGWPVEIALDVEWAHSIAPGAKIVVVASNGQDSEDFQYAMQYIVDNKIGYTVSDSWEEDLDLIAGPLEQQSFEDVLEIAAAQGVSFQFSTGDSGDSGLGTPVGAPGVPSNAPHATAVGGTAILNNINGHGEFLPLGWGDTLAEIDADGVLDPPVGFGLVGGAGGGESTYFAKPSWQASLPGTGRQTPDVSALADPYTGVPIVLTQEGVQSIFPGYGGTSLASPIFTAFWALAQQKAGGPLGQASPLVASLPAGGIEDVLPLQSPTSPIGAILDANALTIYQPADIFSGYLFGSPGFTSAIWNLSSPGQPFFYDFAFGLDGSLTVAQGWDNVTGYGTPYGLTFINAVAKAASAAH